MLILLRVSRCIYYTDFRVDYLNLVVTFGCGGVHQRTSGLCQRIGCRGTYGVGLVFRWIFRLPWSSGVVA